MTATVQRSVLRLQVGARTLATIPRRLIRVGLSLDDALSARAPVLPPLDGADGYFVTSLPDATALDWPGLAHVRQRYTRRWTDLRIGYDAWLATLSSNARSGLKRKARKLATAGTLAIRTWRTPAELAKFHALARPLSAATYQERLLDAGLPDLSAAGEARAWLMLMDDRPIAYLHCTAQGSALRYDHVGHDPAWSAWSPGTVLHARAMEDLFAEGRFARFDFTEGDGQHKRLFATHGVACVDLLLLRPTLANRASIAALAGFDGAVAAIKRSPALARLADQVRR